MQASKQFFLASEVSDTTTENNQSLAFDQFLKEIKSKDQILPGHCIECKKPVPGKDNLFCIQCRAHHEAQRKQGKITPLMIDELLQMKLGQARNQIDDDIVKYKDSLITCSAVEVSMRQGEINQTVEVQSIDSPVLRADFCID